MPEEPGKNEQQSPETPEQPGAVNQPTNETTSHATPDDLAISADELTAAMDAMNAGKPQPTPTGTPAEPASSDSTGSADEVEAAMAAMLNEAETSSTEAAGAAIDETEAAMQAMLDEAQPEETAASAASEAPAPPPTGSSPFEAPSFDEVRGGVEAATLDLLDDVELDVKIELGRTEMYIEDVLGLGEGSVVELDKAAGDPVDIIVNDQLVARGEVLVLNDNFCVRINDIISPVPELEGDK